MLTDLHFLWVVVLVEVCSLLVPSFMSWYHRKLQFPGSASPLSSLHRWPCPQSTPLWPLILLPIRVSPWWFNSFSCAIWTYSVIIFPALLARSRLDCTSTACMRCVIRHVSVLQLMWINCLPIGEGRTALLPMRYMQMSIKMSTTFCKTRKKCSAFLGPSPNPNPYYNPNTNRNRFP